MKAGKSITTKYIGGFDDFITDGTITEGTQAEADAEDKLAQANRIFKLINNGDQFGIIPAFSPLDDAFTNLRKQDALEAAILKLKYGYIPFSTGYTYPDGQQTSKVEQKFFFIPLINLGEIIALGKEFNQPVISGGIQGISSYQVSNIKPEIYLDQTGIMFAFCSLLLSPDTFK